MTFSLRNQAHLWNSALVRAPFALELPEPDVVEFLSERRALGERRVIDIGSGTGRHLVVGALQGLRMVGVDIAENSLRISKAKAAESEVEVELALASMAQLPFRDNSFDGSIAWSSLNHGDRDLFRRSVRESIRVVRPGGWVFGFIMSRRDSRFMHGTRAAEGTKVFTEGVEAGIWHYFPDKTELEQLLREVAVVRTLELCDEEGPHLGAYHPQVTRSSHFYYLATKR